MPLLEIAFALHAGTVLGSVALGLLFKHNVRDPVSERAAETLQVEVDTGEDEVGNALAGGEGEPQDVIVPRGRFVAAAVRAAKAEFGQLVDEPANRRVVHRYLRDMFVERRMRPSHIHHYLPICTELVFVPDRYELEAKYVRNTEFIRNRHHRYAKGYRKYWTWMDALRNQVHHRTKLCAPATREGPSLEWDR